MTEPHVTGPMIDRIGTHMLSAYASVAGLDVCPVGRLDSPIDVLITPSDASWMALVQLKSVTAGFMVHRRYAALTSPIVMIYALLPPEMGGREAEKPSFVVMSATDAWALPAKLGLKYDPVSSDTYRWSRVTQALRDALEPHRAETAADLAALIQRYKVPLV